MKLKTTRTGLEIAVIGMAGAFPGASNVAEFWDNLLGGHSAISLLGDDELEAAGVHPDLLKLANFVKAKGIFPGIEYFDAGFFDYTPRDAAMMDPQMRVLHQCVYHSLEDAGYISEQYKGSIGLFAGASGNFVWELSTLLQTKEGSASQFAAIQLNDKDFLATRIAYKLNLRGPCVTVHCACSTSLYAIDLACRQLLTGACSIAVAAGAGLTLPHKSGYLYEDGMIKSADGACRPFSDDANGTVEGNGMGAVVLKPLEDALRDRDRIYAVIRGTGVNNDGSRKVGFTAPSVEGQAEAIRRALHMADVEADSVTYVEAHGTGTALGDPVEVEALKKAFRTERTGFCGIGSLKSNIGHLDTAAGISAFIKTAMAIKHRQIPPSINFRAPNPGIDFERSPFYVVDKVKEWKNPPLPGSDTEALPLRAGVSSFGIGGTNVHAILEEAPALPPSTAGRDWKLLCLSALDAPALARLEDAMAAHLLNDLDADPSDIAYTAHVGRRNLPVRAAVVYRSTEELFQILQGQKDGIRRNQGRLQKSRVAFLFSGQGTQYPGMALGLYRSEPAFKEQLDRCFAICDRLGATQVRALLLADASDEAAHGLLNRTDLSQPCLFSVEYATAMLLMDWGIAPAAMIGHSLGEYVAACIAGVMSLEQALELVVARGRMMRDMPKGAMLAVAASVAEIETWLPEEIDIAAVNGPAQCTLAGPTEKIEELAVQLQAKNITAKKLHTSHAFHSRMMAPMLEVFEHIVRGISLNAPRIPYISNATGTWITAEQAQDPAYYGRHLRGTVRFADGARQLLQDAGLVFVEVGPGNVLGAFLKQNAQGDAPVTISAIRHAKADADDAQTLLRALGDLWGAGVVPDWKRYYRHETRSKVELPLYPFEKRPFPLGDGDVYRLLQNDKAPAHPDRMRAGAAAAVSMVPGWQSAMLPVANEAFVVRPCLAFVEHSASLKALSQVSGLRLVHAFPGRRFGAEANGGFFCDLDRTTDYRRLARALKAKDGMPELMVWLAQKQELLEKRRFRVLSDRLLRLALSLRSECPDQHFKCLLVLPESRLAGREQSTRGAEIDAFIRSVRAACPQFELRCVYLDVRMADGERAEFIEREIYDADSGTVLAAYEHKRRLVYGLLAAPASHMRIEHFRDKTIALLAPDGYPAQALASRLGKASGARILPVPYTMSKLPGRATLFSTGAEGLRKHLSGEAAQDIRRFGLGDVERAHALMDEICTVLVASYVHAHLPLEPGARWTRSQLKAALRVVDRLEKYVDYFISMFVEDGLVLLDGDGYLVLRGPDSLPDVKDIKAKLRALTPLFDGQLRLLEHCVGAFPAALSEDVPPIEVLYPDGKNTLLKETYAGSIQELEDDVIRGVFEKLVRTIVDSAGGRPLRILEVGGGFGLMMRRIAPMLRGREVEYYFTDIGKTFLHDAKEFALNEGYDFFTFGNFDITRDPAGQGMESKSFDLVFAFNVVHATRSLGATIGNLRSLLKDGGLLCLLERTKIRRYADLIWGLADGWWHFDEAERTLSPLMDLAHWDRLMRGAGFAEVFTFPENEALRSRLDTGVVIAQTAAAETSDHRGNPYRWHFRHPDIDEPLDGAILIEDVHDRPEEAFEPFGDGLIQARQKRNGYAQAAMRWLDRHRPGFVSIWSSGTALCNGADQVERARAGLHLDRLGRARLGEGKWSRVYLPLQDGGGVAAHEDAVLQEALRAVQGCLELAIVEPESQSLFKLASAVQARRRVPEDDAAKRATSEAVPTDSESYVLLLHGLWSELFGIEHIGLDEDFFELGGDSLKVAQLTTELEKHGIKLMSNEVFNCPTIRLLAAYLHETCWNESGQIRDANALTAHLREKMNIESAFYSVVHEGKTCRILFLSDAVFSQQSGAEAILAGLRLPLELEPHYIAPLSMTPAGGRSDLQQDLWRAIGLQEPGNDVSDRLKTAVGHGVDMLNNQVCAAAVVASYPLSPFQKMYLQGATRFSFYLIDFDEPLDLTVLNRAFTDVVRLQGLMRSKMRRNLLGKPVWHEHAPPAYDLTIPVADLSGYTPDAQSALLEKLMESEYEADFDSITGVMYRLALIRFDRRRHTLLFNLDHSIFDNMSGQVLRRQLVNRYRALIAGSKAPMQPIKSFRDYLDQLNRGPQGITKQRLIELFELARYEKAKIAVESRIVARRQPAIGKLRYAIDLDKYQLSDDDEAVWETTLIMLSCVLARFLEQDAVPLKLIYQGRKYQDLSYFDTLGLFVDVLPLLVQVDRSHPERMIDGIKRKIRFVNRYNVSFMNMLLNLSMRFKWWDVLAPASPKKLSNKDPMILLNYVGKAEREYQKVIEFATRQMEKSDQKLDYASFYAITTVVDRQIVFDIFCNFEKDMDVLRAIFDEETARLLPQADTGSAPPSTAPAEGRGTTGLQALASE